MLYARATSFSSRISPQHTSSFIHSHTSRTVVIWWCGCSSPGRPRARTGTAHGPALFCSAEITRFTWKSTLSASSCPEPDGMYGNQRSASNVSQHDLTGAPLPQCEKRKQGELDFLAGVIQIQISTCVVTEDSSVQTVHVKVKIS
eukprot:scpid57397/ scgid11022/ 